MARHAVSVIRSAPAARPGDPVLDANAYAIAEDIVLQLVLRAGGVEHAVAVTEPGAGGQDLRALIESGINVHAEAEALAARGLQPTDLVDGVHVAPAAELIELVADAEAVLTW